MGGRRCLWVTASDGLFDNAINSMDEIFGGEDMAPAILLRRIQLETHRSQREKIEVLLVTYRDLVECDKAKTIEKWLGKSYSGLVSGFMPARLGQIAKYWYYFRCCLMKFTWPSRHIWLATTRNADRE